MDWKGLTLRQKIGQAVIKLSKIEKEIEEFGSIENLLEQYPVGGFFIGTEVISEKRCKEEHYIDLVKSYNNASKVPLIITADLENGCGFMTERLTDLPYLMNLGAISDDKKASRLSYEYGKVTGVEAQSIGVNIALAPVVDLNINPFNSITNIRAVSDDLSAAQNILPEIIKGFQEHGLGACAKHFPGDGVDYRDHHISTSTNSLSKEEWDRTYGEIYKKIIENDVYSIMAGHICLPAYQTPNKNGKYLPATLSYELITNLLKEQLGFKGVVISDALVMGGYLKWYKTRPMTDIECLKAGVDMLLWPKLEYIDNVEKMVEAGEIPIERINDAVERIWNVKDKLGLLNNKIRFTKVSEKDLNHGQKIADEVAEESITLLRDENNMLPIKKDVKKIHITTVTHYEPAKEKLNQLVNEFENRGMSVKIDSVYTRKQLAAEENDYDLFLYALYARPHHPFGGLDFDGEQLENIWGSLCSAKEKTIAVSFGSPYQLNHYFELCPACINAYSLTKSTISSVAKAICGEIQFEGKSPVKL